MLGTFYVLGSPSSNSCFKFLLKVVVLTLYSGGKGWRGAVGGGGEGARQWNKSKQLLMLLAMVFSVNITVE